MTATPAEIVLYGRPGCHLCDDTHALLEALLAKRAAAGLLAPTLVVRSIEGHAALEARYHLVIPVVTFGGRELQLAIRPSEVVRFVTDALDGVAAGTER